MSDRRPDDPAEQPSARDPIPGTVPGSPPEPAEAVQRRDFLRQLTGEAVVTSARLAGLSSVFRRSLVAAGEAAMGDPDPSREESQPAIESSANPAGMVLAAPASGPAAAPASPSEPAVAVALTARQEAVLTHAMTAILGTNDPAGGPHLTSSTFHWDGTIVRLPSELFAARVVRIDADPRVSVLVADDASDGWVAMRGTAWIVSGDAVEAEMLTILRKSMTDEEADRSWTELRSSGDPVVIGVRPSSYVWRLD
jgi:pyridoxamine 5'-phosphate oxidase-like protein